MRIRAGNYVDRASGAVYVQIDASRIYFHTEQVVAVVAGGILFRSAQLKGGIVHRRIRAAVGRDVMKVVEIPHPELNEMATKIIIQAASDEIDRQLTKGESDA